MDLLRQSLGEWSSSGSFRDSDSGCSGSDMFLKLPSMDHDSSSPSPNNHQSGPSSAKHRCARGNNGLFCER